ncbi:MAG TPA: DMT family transporter [Caldilineae bacterium]|nr:DMT family transporter [Caldilineae bacterium]
MRRQMWADLALLAVVTVWGMTFVMVKEAVTSFPVFAFLAARFSVAAVALLPIAWREALGCRFDRRLLWQGALMGVALFAGYGLQTMGLRYTTPAKAGFITGISVVLVPLGSAWFLRRPPSHAATVGVFLATVGLALLSLNEDLAVGLGDLLVLGCAVSFAVQIILTAAFAPGQPAVRLAMVQIATVALLSGVTSLLWEFPLPAINGQVIFAVVFTGVLATSFAFATQTVAQRFTSPTHTALIFSLEPVFAAAFSYLLIGERLTGRALLGCAFILFGMLTAELGDLAWRSIGGKYQPARRRREPIS